MSPRFDPTGRPRRELPRGWYDASQLSPSIGLGNDDQAALADAVGTVEALGGGGLLIPSIVHLGADLDVPRSVILGGVGASTSQIKSDGTQRRVNITGVPADSVAFDGDLYAAIGLAFDNVSLDFGPNSGDVPRGCKAIQCQFVNSDYGARFEGGFGGSFAGVGLVSCKARLVDYGVQFDGVGPNHILTDCDLGECNEASIWCNGGVGDGVSLFIKGCYSDHCRRFLKVTGTATDGTIHICGGGVELCGTSDTGSYADGFGIENEWANIWIDGLNFFSGPHTTAMFWQKGGVIYNRSGRQYWDVDKFCRIDGGYIVFYQDGVFSPGKIFGEGQAGGATASSSGGRIFAPRSGYVGNHNVNITQLTHASPVQNLRFGEAWDGNDREWTAEVISLANGTANGLRVQLADGVHTISHDLVFPLIAGGGRLRVVNKRGVEWEASITYAPSASGTIPAAVGAPTKAEFDAAAAFLNKQAVYKRLTTADTSTIGNTRYLSLTTLTGGGTASTINVSNLVEHVSGPAVVGI